MKEVPRLNKTVDLHPVHNKMMVFTRLAGRNSFNRAGLAPLSSR
jgi:hypothetical protein